MSNEALLKSLFRREISVLYWKCKGEQYQQIALRNKKKDGSTYTEEWVQKQVTNAYAKLQVPPGTREEKTDYLFQHFCNDILKLQEEELRLWPLYGWKSVEKDGQTVYEPKTKKDFLEEEARQSPQTLESVLPTNEEEGDEEEVEPEIPLSKEPEQAPEAVPDQKDTEPPTLSQPNSVPRETPESVTPAPPDQENNEPSSSLTGSDQAPADDEKKQEFIPPPNRPINRLWIVAAGFICLVCALIGWMAISRGLRNIFSPGPPLSTNTPPQSLATFTVVVPITEAATNTVPPVPTLTETLTNTPLPTDTLLPSDTPTQTTVPAEPTEPAAFFDDFNNGLNPAWTVEYGTPVVTDGQLVASESTQLSVGDTAWTNYKVEFDVKMGNFTCQDEDSSTLGVRASDIHNMLLLRFHPCEIEWSSVINGNRKVIPNTFLGNQGFADKFVHFIVEVEGNKISLYEKSNLLKSFIDNDHPSGKVYLRVRTLTVFDNFKITLLNQ